MAEFRLPDNWTEYRPHAQQDAVRGPGVARRATPPGQGGSSGSAEPQGGTGRAPMSYSTPGQGTAGGGGATPRAEEQPLPFWSSDSLRDLGLRWFGGQGIPRPHVPGQVTPPNREPQVRPSNVTPQKASPLDLLYMMADVPARNGTSPFQFPGKTTPMALDPLSFVQHGTGPAYAVERGLGLPVPGRTPR